MKPLSVKMILLSTLCFMVFMTGCSDGPTGLNFGTEPTGLGEAILKTLLPMDGLWFGKTSQDENISFTVSQGGSQVDSLAIKMLFDEYWGYGWIKIKMLKSIPIVDMKFNYDGSSFDISGTFENSTYCTGKFNSSGTIGYPYYYSYSTEGTWTATWSMSNTGNLSKQSTNNALPDGKAEYAIKDVIDNDSVKITLHILEKYENN